MAELNFINDIKSYKDIQDIIIFISGFSTALSCKITNLPDELISAVEDFNLDIHRAKYPDIYNKLWNGDKFIYFNCFSQNMCKYRFIPIDWKIKYISNPLDILTIETINKDRFRKNFDNRCIFDATNVNFYSNPTKAIRIKNEKKDTFMKMHQYILNIKTDSIDLKKLGTSVYETLYIFRKDVLNDFIHYCLSCDKISVFKSLFENMYAIENKLSYFTNCNETLFYDLDTLYMIQSILPKIHDMTVPVFGNSYFIVKRNFDVVLIGEPFIELCFDIVTDIKKILTNIYDAIDWKTTSLSGGIIAKIVKCYCDKNNKLYIEDSDIDLFTTNTEFSYVNVFKRLATKSEKKSDNTTLLEINNLKINLIVIKDTDIFMSVSNFDFSCVKGLYNDSFGLKLFISCILSNLTSTNYLYSKYSKIKPERFEKYIKRGYSFILNKNEIAKINKDNYKVFEVIKN